jgi:hypothetical protein
VNYSLLTPELKLAIEYSSDLGRKLPFALENRISILEDRAASLVKERETQSVIINKLQSTVADLKTKDDGLERSFKNEFERLWEWKKLEIESMIHNIIDGYLNDVITVTITKNLRLDYADSA